jgi:Ca-activated chloride channel family protein
MNAFHFANPAALVLLLAVPLLVAAYLRGDRGRNTALAAWGRGPAPAPRREWKRALPVAACTALAFALARPTTGPAHAPRQEQSATGDIVFLLDVSRSMLADDVLPMRLYRGRDWIKQLAAQASRQRVGLVAFAGSQAVQCPLTLDHAFFEEMVNASRPDSVARGGTKIGDAIRFATAHVFDDVERDEKTLVVVSDGGDQENAPAAAARDAAKLGIRVIAVGIGDPAGSAVVPEGLADHTPVIYQGQPVATRLEEGTLRAIGEYVNGGAGPIDAADVYRRLLTAKRRPANERNEGGDRLWMACLIVAILLLSIDSRVPERRVMQAVVLAAAVLGMPVSGLAQTVNEWFAKGTKALEERRYEDAVRYFSDAAQWAPYMAEIRFNLGKALYESDSYAEAAGSFGMAANATRDSKLKARCKLGQGNSLYRDAGDHGSQMVPRLQEALAAYKEAEALDPELFDAEYNRRVVERRLRDNSPRALLPPDGGAEHAPSDADAEKLLKEMSGAHPTTTVRAKDDGVERDW